MRRISLSLRQQITALGTLSALLATVTVAILVLANERSASKAVSNEVIGMMQDRLARSVEKTHSICKISQDFVQKAVDTSLSSGDVALKQAGGIQLTGKTVTWTGVNQFTQARTSITVPEWALKGAPLTPDRAFNHHIPVIDEITKQTGETVTLFQRVNPAGDMLRVASTVTASDGQRAIGTYNPAIMPGGSENPVVKTVLSGQTYRGRAYVVNAWYITAYEPLRNAKGDIIGMFYVGVKQEGLPLLREAISVQSHTGDHSSVAIYYGPYTQNLSNMVVIHPTVIYTITNSKWLPEVLSKAPKLDAGASGVVTATTSINGSQAIVHYAYFKPWDWVIVAIGDSSDYAGATDLV